MTLSVLRVTYVDTEVCFLMQPDCRFSMYLKVLIGVNCMGAWGAAGSLENSSLQAEGSMLRLQGHPAVPTNFWLQVPLTHCEGIVETKAGQRPQNYLTVGYCEECYTFELACISAAVVLTHCLLGPPSQMRTWDTHSSSLLLWGQQKKCIISTGEETESQGFKCLALGHAATHPSH